MLLTNSVSLKLVNKLWKFTVAFVLRPRCGHLCDKKRNFKFLMVSNQFSCLLSPFLLNSLKVMYFIEFLKRKWPVSSEELKTSTLNSWPQRKWASVAVIFVSNAHTTPYCTWKSHVTELSKLNILKKSPELRKHGWFQDSGILLDLSQAGTTMRHCITEITFSTGLHNLSRSSHDCLFAAGLESSEDR